MALFPDPREAPVDAPLGWGGELSVACLQEAYSRGIFPWYSEGEPILWWSPDPRFAFRPARAVIPRSVAKEARKAQWRVTYDTCFSRVIRACAAMARPGQEGTWITGEMIAAYEALHAVGWAHSVECWCDGDLAGGCYGVAVGAAFCGESMFYRRANASKVAFAHLLADLQRWGFTLIDCQQPTAHLARFGATEWPRDAFLDALAEAAAQPPHWGVHSSW